MTVSSFCPLISISLEVDAVCNRFDLLSSGLHFIPCAGFVEAFNYEGHPISPANGMYLDVIINKDSSSSYLSSTLSLLSSYLFLRIL